MVTTIAISVHGSSLALTLSKLWGSEAAVASARVESFDIVADGTNSAYDAGVSVRGHTGGGVSEVSITTQIVTTFISKMTFDAGINKRRITVIIDVTAAEFVSTISRGILRELSSFEGLSSIAVAPCFFEFLDIFSVISCR